MKRKRWSVHTEQRVCVVLAACPTAALLCQLASVCVCVCVFVFCLVLDDFRSRFRLCSFLSALTKRYCFLSWLVDALWSAIFVFRYRLVGIFHLITHIFQSTISHSGIRLAQMPRICLPNQTGIPVSSCVSMFAINGDVRNKEQRLRRGYDL